MVFRNGTASITAFDAEEANRLCRVLRHLTGRVHGGPLLFKNHAALPETLLLAGWDLTCHTSGGLRDEFTIVFTECLTRGVCEDGVTRRTGWYRFYRPDTGRFEKLTTDWTARAEDVYKGGFEALVRP